LVCPACPAAGVLDVTTDARRSAPRCPRPRLRAGFIWRDRPRTRIHVLSLHDALPILNGTTIFLKHMDDVKNYSPLHIILELNGIKDSLYCSFQLTKMFLLLLNHP